MLKLITLITIALLGFTGSAKADWEETSKKNCVAEIAPQYHRSYVDKYDASKNITTHMDGDGGVIAFNPENAMYGGHPTYLIGFDIVDSTGQRQGYEQVLCILTKSGTVMGVEPFAHY